MEKGERGGDESLRHGNPSNVLRPMKGSCLRREQYKQVYRKVVHSFVQCLEVLLKFLNNLFFFLI